jgi:biopolymer transport protein ExbD
MHRRARFADACTTRGRPKTREPRHGRSLIATPQPKETAMSFALARSHAAPEASINVTPLIDVMLALVVVFMIAAPILVKRVTLPLANGGHATVVVEPAHLGVAADGALTWNDEALLPQMLGEQLRVLARKDPQPELRIEVAPTARYQAFASVLADAKFAGVERIVVVHEASR